MAWNLGTHALVVEAALVRRDVKAMMSALEAMKKAGFDPPAALVDRVVQRLEREGATVLLVRSCLFAVESPFCRARPAP